MTKRACFLDRDGVINVDKNYVYTINRFEWIEGAKEAIKYLKKNNFYVFIATNQSGIARGLYTERDVEMLHEFINSELIKIDTKIDDFFISPFHPDFPDLYSNLSNLRKPDTGMLELAQKKWNFDKPSSLMIGDNETDMQCAAKFGINGYLFKDGSLYNFVKKILNIN